MFAEAGDSHLILLLLHALLLKHKGLVVVVLKCQQFATIGRIHATIVGSALVTANF